MERVVNFYAGLPRGPAPEVKATGLIGRYQARYFGKNASGVRKYLVALNRMDLCADMNSHCARYCRYPDHGLRHGVLLPPA